MKKAHTFLLTISAVLIVLIALISCQAQQNAAPEPANEQQQVILPKEEVVPEIQVMLSPNISEEAKQLLLKKEKVKSYVYSFGELNQRNTYAIMENKVKISLREKPGKMPEDQYDTVYLDNAEKKAYGVCEKSGCDNLRLQYRTVDYQKHKLGSTPFDIFDDLIFAEVESSTKKLVNNRDTVLMKMNTTQGIRYEAFVDQFFSFPHEVMVISPSGEKKLVQYFNVQINSLTDQDVTVPSSYTFINSSIT